MIDNILDRKLNVANIPTSIEKNRRFKIVNEIELWIKRDDYTGIELSGNKIRKLEYLLYDALNNNADTIITCGGEQSNHARATAIAAAKLGLKTILVLRTFGSPVLEGNVLLGSLVGSKIKWITPEDYSSSRTDIMMSIKAEIDDLGGNAYIIPEGGSNSIGALGYVSALKEIKMQQNVLGVEFDEIICAVGSGGTLAGLISGKKEFGIKANIVGINVCDDEEYFINEILKIGVGLQKKFGLKAIDKDDINIIDGYVGQGYAKATLEELKLQSDFSKNEGIILDPVYSGKAFYGMIKSIENKVIYGKKLLFIHTGGIYGIFSFKNQYENII